jgi:transcription elongation factor/antiterminator RfaH
MDQNSQRWYVLYTKPRFEKKVHLQLLQKQIESYLPLHKVTRRWSDRKKKVEEALFPNYIFVHTQEKERLASLETAGVVRCVSFGGRVAVVPDSEIQSLKRMLSEDQPVQVYPIVALGTKVRITRGPLSGVEGVLTEIRGMKRFALTIEALRRSVLMEIDAGDVKALSE